MPVLDTPIGRHALAAAGLAALLLALPALAQDRADRTWSPDWPRVAVAEGREFVVLGPQLSGSDGVPPALPAQPVPAGLSTRSYTTDSQWIHVVEFGGRTYRAAAPLEGPRSRVVFDPVRRGFASLLPSIRIELKRGLQPDAIAEALDAVRVTVFEPLGFAIVDLPEHLHPADAVALVRNLPGQPEAAVRLRGPVIEWK